MMSPQLFGWGGMRPLRPPPPVAEPMDNSTRETRPRPTHSPVTAPGKHGLDRHTQFGNGDYSYYDYGDYYWRLGIYSGSAFFTVVRGL